MAWVRKPVRLGGGAAGREVLNFEIPWEHKEIIASHRLYDVIFCK
jgi:hypothetical protein